MFWKKKPKEEPAPPPARAAEPQRAPQPEQRRPEAPRTAAPPPADAGDLRGRVLAALSVQIGPFAAPSSPESDSARNAAIDSLLADAALRAAALDIVAQKVPAAFDAIERDAPSGGAAKWRRAGALMYGADGPRARKAFEAAFAQDQRDYLGCLLLARLRGMMGDLDGANLAGSAAVLAAKTPQERGVAHSEAALIAMARNDFASAVTHGQQAVEVQRASIVAGARDADALREMIMRLTVLGDATVSTGAPAEARAHYEEALNGARKLAAVDPSHQALQRGLAELLEKAGATASGAQDHARALQAAEEAVAIRRRILAGGADPQGERTLASALNSLGEVKRLAGDRQGAKVAFDEAMVTARRASARNPSDMSAKREVWSVMWRLAVMGDAGIGWPDVVDAMDALASNGGLGPRDYAFYEEARKRAAA